MRAGSYNIVTVNCTIIQIGAENHKIRKQVFRDGDFSAIEQSSVLILQSPGSNNL